MLVSQYHYGQQGEHLDGRKLFFSVGIKHGERGQK